MVFSWLQQRRRQKLLAAPFPAQWYEYLEGNVAHYRYLATDQQERLRDDVRVLVAEKNWEGCGGLAMTDEIKVTVSALACLLILELEHDFYSRVLSILVYPTGYAAPASRYEEGWVVVGTDARLGEAWYRGPVVLSWADVLEDARHPGTGRNLVFHEFAHQLDMLDRVSDGTPPLHSGEQYKAWQKVMTAEFDRLIAAANVGRLTLLDHYGATNEAEFFAVSTECFFDQPYELRAEHPQLYRLLQEYYRQDPAARVPRTKG